jgi:hypothetical protein
MFIAALLGPDKNSYSAIRQLIQDTLPSPFFVHSCITLVRVFDQLFALAHSQSDLRILRFCGESSTSTTLPIMPTSALAISYAARGLKLPSRHAAPADDD